MTIIICVLCEVIKAKLLCLIEQCTNLVQCLDQFDKPTEVFLLPGSTITGGALPPLPPWTPGGALPPLEPPMLRSCDKVCSLVNIVYIVFCCQAAP